MPAGRQVKQDKKIEKLNIATYYPRVTFEEFYRMYAENLVETRKKINEIIERLNED